MLAATDIPALVKHTTLAIFKHGGMVGPRAARFTDAWRIARGRLYEYGYLTADSASPTPAKIVLTPRGWEQNKKHIRERNGAGKAMQFDALYEEVFGHG